MLLSNELSLARKIREIILAMRLEKSLTKDRSELYLNEIFPGSRSYGVAAAALNYFNKSLDELTLAEAAYLRRRCPRRQITTIRSRITTRPWRVATG